MATAFASVSLPAAAVRQPVACRKSFTGAAVSRVARPAVCRAQRTPVIASASKVELPAAVTVAMGAVLASPLAAQAGVTPSLKNLINSVVAGGVVLGVIVAAVTAVSGFDPVSRGK
ncbi:hypothetical protein WJX81_006377 [Elliptochloris bilobata]|uniref:Uncharacterized protein n=1 Tax=Elliptochloris bilobata TaxID=381761 RepID=A0AAW1QUG8_9CHLO